MTRTRQNTLETVKNALQYLLCAMSLALAAAPAPAATKVFLLAGQSNMGGVGLASELVGPLAKYKSESLSAVHYWNDVGPWGDLSSAAGNTYFGPELSFGYQMHLTCPGDDIYLIKYSVAGSNLAQQWSPADAGWCYTSFRSFALAALKTLKDSNLSPTLAGMLWMQGEADAYDLTMATAYQQNLTDLVRHVRNDFDAYGAENMQFVIGRITQDWPTAEGNALVRAAQEAVPSVAGVGPASWIDTDDLQRSTFSPPHYGTQGQIDLGKRFAARFAPVPEPAASVSLTLGLAGMLIYARRMRKTPRTTPNRRRGNPISQYRNQRCVSVETSNPRSLNCLIQ